MHLLLSPFKRRSKAKRGDVEEGTAAPDGESDEEKTETACSSPALTGPSCPSSVLE
jgi:hypothetical protein